MKEKLKSILNLDKILEIYIVIQFIIDVATSFCVRYVSESLSLGIFMRTAFLIVLVCYSFFKSDKKDKIKLLIFYVVLGAYLVAFLAMSYKMYGMIGFFSQIKGALKTFYLPIILVALFSIWKNKNIKLNNNIFIYTLLGYTGVIFFARIFNISYSSYPSYNNGAGTMGLFYAANEIGGILSLLAPFTFLELLNGKRKMINVIALIVLIFASLELGTKVPFISLILVIFVALYSCIVKLFNKSERKENIQKFGVIVAIAFCIIMLFPYMPISINMKNAYGISIPRLINNNNNNKNIGTEPTEIPPNEKPETKEQIETAVYSSRNIYLEDNLEKYSKSSLASKILGIGYLREEPDTKEITELKLVEIDYYDIFVCHGIVGTLIYIVPFMYLFFKTLNKILKNIKKVFLDRELIFMEYSIMIALIVAFTAGHIFTAPGPALFLAINILRYCKKIDEKSREEIAFE